MPAHAGAGSMKKTWISWIVYISVLQYTFKLDMYRLKYHVEYTNKQMYDKQYKCLCTYDINTT